VLVDCPPLLGVLMINALAACEHLIIPVQTEFLALKGLERMLLTLTMVLRTRQRPLPVTIVPTLFDRRTRAAVESLQALREGFPEQLWHGVIPVDTRLREASRAGLPPGRFAPDSHAVLAYTELLHDLLSEGAPQARPGAAA
jgi:chromosome partitioning protein